MRTRLLNRSGSRCAVAASCCWGGAATAPFAEGDVVRFAEGDVHGLENTGSVEFVYLSVTSPPINFRGAYAADWQASGNNAA